jgi:hypothetical protein
MAVSHQSGTILHHWNDPPTATFSKNKSASSSTVSLALPTPPLTPSIETNDSLARELEHLLEMSSSLVGRNKEMIFTRVRALIKSVEERRITGTSSLGWDVDCRFAESGVGGDDGGCSTGGESCCEGTDCEVDE